MAARERRDKKEKREKGEKRERRPRRDRGAAADDGDKKSSIRDRVSRARGTYSNKTNYIPMVIVGTVMLIFMIGFYYMMESGAPPDATQNDTSASDTDDPEAAKPATPDSDPMPILTGTSEQQMGNLMATARGHQKTDPDKALKMLQGAPADLHSYPDLHFAMASAVEAKITKNPGALRSLAAEKVRHYKKVQELLDSGKGWLFDPMGNKSSHLKQNLERARKDAGLTTPAPTRPPPKRKPPPRKGTGTSKPAGDGAGGGRGPVDHW